jgi:hypothetical protein
MPWENTDFSYGLHSWLPAPPLIKKPLTMVNVAPTNSRTFNGFIVFSISRALKVCVVFPRETSRRDARYVRWRSVTQTFC